MSLVTVDTTSTLEAVLVGAGPLVGVVIGAWGAARIADELVGLRDGVLHVRVSARPVDGRANLVLRRLIARRVRVAPSRVMIVRGERSREKLVRIDGIDQPSADAMLAGPERPAR